MKRNELFSKISGHNAVCDILIIGGGATGLGTAVDAASRGFKVVLLEQNDFAKATSSRSTKLVHGGVRYLAQGDVQMVVGALRERGLMRKNAPHLVKDMRFIIGNYRWWEQPFYAIGLTAYDLLAGRLGLGRSLPLLKKTVMKEIPGLKQAGLRGGVVYHDGQFDDARMAITLAQTAVDHGAVCLNYVKAEKLLKDGKGKLIGVNAVDQLTGEKYVFKTKVIINATGVFVDEIMKMDAPENKKKVRPSQGVHLVVDSKFLGGNSALMIPKTKDGRVLFGVPWHDKVVLGTTDTPLNNSALEPRALEDEVDFILDQAGQYLGQKISRSDVLSVFAGLRPLAAPTHSDCKKTKEISRNHKIYISKSGLLTITGGKWTTYREMAEDIVNRSIEVARLENKPCVTRHLKVHGYAENVDTNKWDYVYGSDCVKLNSLIKENSANAELLHKNYTFNAAHVVWAVREEMAQSVEDVLARRARLLFLDARAAIEAAPKVAAIMSKEMNKDKDWEKLQVKSFTQLANNYILH
ncbi:glycerol-3-phosphate dehydrogenase/oxidase [uncultured Bacteroides sp.]|uniref:glycerol-3-phosphate dehydrogenase/oxidase n=1 Tax=uncultured Bacteroides sp. TaxID=162156 RepID=UPI002AAAE778|nr:glycerol-3-phosphate dehydrogenase/oxidase [uncultured Bacteroides sp.]